VGTDDTPVETVYAVPVLSADVSGTSVMLRWTVMADSAVTVSYEYQTLNSAGTVLTQYSRFVLNDVTSAPLTLPAGTYSFRVRRNFLRAAGTQEGEWSNSQMITIQNVVVRP
jgi:hypothetical protein